MAISREEVFRKALGLDASDRTELVGLLIDSLDPETEQGAEAAWLQEIDRRARDLDSGTVQAIPCPTGQQHAAGLGPPWQGAYTPCG